MPKGLSLDYKGQKGCGKHLQPFMKGEIEFGSKFLSFKSLQVNWMTISYLFFKEQILNFKASFKTGLQNHSKARISKTRLFNAIKNCFESFDKNYTSTNKQFVFVMGKFEINYHLIQIIKYFYKDIFDKLKPVDDHEGNSLVFEAKIKLVEDFLIYNNNQVGDSNYQNLREHFLNLNKNTKPGSAGYFDWSTPLISLLWKQRYLDLLMTKNLVL
ncbi:hypothetical protein PSHT_05950 [Puccinia striiformis]|uniref:Uncharacterized protein n=1 Tax=Puccinia striiformis TaxID=27350 RepID=A0A2S4W9A1_9BASI|nr:hypothetical protein PSHT_05950 [Puccinia striiformis]